MSYQNTGPATKMRHRERRPGVEAAARVQPNTESAVRYLVVTQSGRTYHESFNEAAAEYWQRRALFATVGR